MGERLLAKCRVCYVCSDDIKLLTVTTVQMVLNRSAEDNDNDNEFA